jgi:hypothetical protein
LACAACGGDGPTAPTFPQVGGYYQSATMWRVSFVREHDGFSGSFTCWGTLTLNQESEPSRNPDRVTVSGFGTVGYPCPVVAVDLAGDLQPDGRIGLIGGGPRPPEGQCPSPVRATYLGVASGPTLSAKATQRIYCPGPGEGYHQFDYVLTATLQP